MPFLKPENALKRAEEFIDVGKKKRALDTLYEVIRSKKHRSWQKIHEQIMKSYLSLCVDLKESHMAKDGLHQYKTICQNVNVKSLEDVISGFLQLAEEKAEKAKKDASVATSANNNAANLLLTDVDDLEYINSPESVLLKAVSGESSQDRADRDVLAPWLKFVWESYKQCLDLLKNNNKVEALYQQVAKQAFSFCVKYQRKTEFRKLCETLRQHMIQGHKYSNQTQTSIDMSKPETQNYHLETRMLQLNNAISMELWQEAYKAVEDIYALMSMSKTKPKPGQMFNYYSKLSLIFWKAGNHLFHAATLQKLYVLLKEQKKTITQEELTKISTRQLLATLAIPITPNRSLIDECLDQDEVTLEKLKRLSSLLNLQQPPTRFTLLKDLAKYNVVQHVFPEVRDLYKSLEVEFNPLKLSERVNKCLDYLEARPDAATENYAQYIQSIKEITVTRLLKQISQIYTTIEIKRFLQLAPKGVDSFLLEKIIVDAAKQLDLQIRINHQTKSLHFGNDLYVSQRDDLQEGPSIQSMPSEQVRTQLINMSQALQQAQQLIYGSENKTKVGDLAQTIANVYRQTCDKHHMELLKRKQFIEKQKEIYENLANERERVKNEEKRLKQEEKDSKMNKFASIKERGDQYGGYEDELSRQQRAIIAANEKEDDEINKQIEQANKERRELVEKMKKEEKKYDHFVRACHENEIPLIQKFTELDAEARKQFWDEKEIERIENLKEEMRVQAENKERLLRMSGDKDSFLSLIHAARKADYEKKIEDFKVKLVAAREAKLRERKEKRKTDRRNAHFRAIEEKKRKEEEERRAKEDEEKRRKQNEQAEKQRRREQEIEEKMKSESSKQPPSAGGTSAEDKAAPAGAGGVYRPRAAGGAGFAGRVDRPAAPAEGGESNWRRAAGGGGGSSAGGEPESAWRRDDRGEQRQDGGRRIIDDEGGSSMRRDFGGRGGDRNDRGEGGGRDFGSRGGDRGDREGGGRDFGSRGGDRDGGGRDFGSRGGDRSEGGRDFGGRGGDRPDRGEGGRDFGNRGGDRGGDRGGERGGDRGEGGRDFGNRGGDREGGRGGGRGGYQGGERKPGGPGRSDRGGGGGFGGDRTAGADSSDNWRSGPR